MQPTITSLMVSESPTVPYSQFEMLQSITDNNMTTSAIPNSRSDITTISATSDLQSVVLGAVGGLLAVGAITAISVSSVIITVVVVIRNHKRKLFEKGCTNIITYPGLAIEAFPCFSMFTEKQGNQASMVLCC